MVTICPYKLVLLAVTVVFAALVAWNQSSNEGDDDHKEDEETSTTVGWDTWWETPWFRSVKNRHPVAYKTCYTVCITLLVIFHFEVFTGGMVCRTLFAPAATYQNASMAVADGIVAA
eukprot:m.165174 g.165174  ORF g.165174 m.165174 type:complete len:117 (+) comp12526_c0_seq1:277-627(+)